MFANDTNLFYQHKDINELFRVIISELEKVCDWSHANKLTKCRKDNIYIYIYIYIYIINTKRAFILKKHQIAIKTISV